MAIVGRAQVLVSPSFSGFQRDVGKEAAGAGKTFGTQMTKSSPKIGLKLVAGLGKVFKAGVIGVGAAAGAGLGFALVKGFQRLQAIDNARAKLEGLGHSAKAVDGIMNDALQSVKGTAFGLDEAATTAGAIVASGIKPGKELRTVLTTVADTATIAGTSMSDMGAIFGSVAARGKLQGDDMMQLTSKGVPVLQFLAKHYGITAQAASKMVSEGQVDFKNFAAAMKENIGGAAQASGKTFTGAFANLKASLGRIGANLLSGVFSQLAPLLTDLTKKLGMLEDAAKPLGQVLGAQFAKVIPVVVSGLVALVTTVGNIVAWMVKWQDVLVPLGIAIAVVAAGIGVLAIQQEAAAAGGFLKWILSIIKATKAWNVVLAIQNAIMNANPISLIIIGLVALGAALVVAYKKSATFRAIVQGALHGIATAAQWMWNTVLKPVFAALVTAFHAVVTAGKTVGTALTAAFHAVVAAGQWMWNTVLKPVFTALRSAFSAVGTVFATVGKAIGSAFRAVGKVIRTVYNGWIKPVIQLFAAIVKWLVVKYIQTYLKIIRFAWQAMASLVRKIYQSVIKPTINAFAAVAKWLWGKILKPAFTAIKTGFRVLGTGIKTIYNTVIKPIINAFAAIGKWLWNKILKPAFNAIKTGFHTVGTGIRSVYNTVIKPILTAFSKLAKAVKSAASTAFNGIRSAWSTTSKSLSSVFHGAMSKTFSAFKTAGKGMKSAFGAAVSGIGTAWSKLSELAKKPIHFIIDSVINKGLIKGFNSLARTFGTKEMKWLPLPFAHGGVVPGHSRAADGDSMVATVRPGEGWTVSEAMDRYERARLVNLNKAALRGETASSFRQRWDGQSFKNGGIVKPTKSGRQNASYAGHSGIDFFGNVGDPIVAATAGRISYTGAGRGYGNAIFEAAANGLQMVYGHTSAILAKVGQQVQAGQQIGRVGYSGNVRPPGPAGAHLHFEIAPGGRFALPGNRDATQKWLGGGGLVGKIIGAVKGAVNAAGNFDPSALLKGAVSKIIGGAKWLTQTPFGQLAAKVPVALAERAIQYVKDKFGSLFSSDGVSASWSGAKVGSLGSDQLNNAATIMKTAKSLGFGQRGAIIGLMTAMQESTLRNLSGGDRDSVGLFQQRAPWGPFSARHNPAQAAAMFFQGGKGGQPGLKSKNWKSLPLGVAAQQVQVSAFPDAYNKWEGLARQLVGKGYATGTRSATPGLHLVAEHGPELITSPQARWFRGGEQVKTASQTAALAGPQRIVGELKLANGKAYIEGVVEDVAKKAMASI